MLEILANKYGQATSEIVRSLLAVVIVAGVIILIVTGASDMGLGTEITNNRVLVWTCTAGLAFLFGLGYEIYSLTSRLNESSAELGEVRSENNDLREALEEAQDERDSVLRLMERYRRNAYDEILDELYLIVNALDMRDNWIENNACVKQVSIDINNNDEYRSLPERVNELSSIHINIGKQDGVIEGMVFEVVDPSRINTYGKITVDDVGVDGSICSLIEGFNTALWSEVRSAIGDNESRIISVKENYIVPLIPKEIENAESGKLEELKEVVKYISKS